MTPILHLLDGLGHYVVNWSWQLALLVAFLWIVLRFDRRHRPELRYRLLFLTLVLSILLPWVPNNIAAFSWTARIKEVWLEPVATTVRTTPGPKPLIERSVNRLFPIPPVPEEASAATGPGVNILFPVLGLLWCGGIAFAAVRKLRQHHRFAGIVKRATVSPLGGDVTLPILLSDEVSGPMLYGAWRPVILLPSNISEWSTPEERAAVVRHEFVHFKRGDHWVSTLEGLLRTILFFHPMLRWACQRLDLERELVCDAEVLRLGSDPDTYAGTLLKVAQHAVVQPAGVYFASAAELTERFELLLHPHRTARIVLATVPLFLLMPLASLGFWQATAESFEPLESTWALRFLPRIPLPPPGAGVVPPPPPPPPMPVTAELTQNSIPSPAEPQSRPVRTAVTVLRGQGVFNEVRIAVGIPYANITFSQRGNSVLEANGTVEGQITKQSGKVEARLDDAFSVSVPLTRESYSKDGIGVVQYAFLLSPGAYRMFFIIHDAATGNKTLVERSLEIPSIPRSGVSTSSLVLADLIQSEPARNSLSLFTIGDLRVRPNVTGRFRQNQELNIFQQIYSDGSGPLVLETVITANGQEFRRFSDEFQKAPELTITKRIPLVDFPPGTYGIQTTVTDPVGPQTVASRSEFTVE